MMVPKKSLFLAGVAVLFASAATAQSQGEKTSFRRYTGPLTTVDLDLESGVITRGPVVQQRVGGTSSVFSNIDLGGFVGADTGSCACEWYDAGVKNGGASTYVSGFVFAYCSSATDPISGGPGGSASMFFNSGYTLGANGAGMPANGTDLARVLVTGLPANTACSSFFGGFRCFFITIRFAATFCLPDGNIGYGWKFIDMGTPGVLAKTFPFLSCVQSCTGPGPDGLGMVDMVDQYCPPGFLLSTFSFGTTANGSYFTSVSMDIREAASTGALANAAYVTSNSAILADNGGTLGVGPNIGDGAQPYGIQIGCGAATTSGLYRIDVRPGLVPAGLSTGFGLLAAAGPVLQKFTGMHSQNVQFTPTIPLPKDVSFACLPFTNQGWCQSSPKGILSSALRQTVGVP
jgi:hypothetical protein